MTAQTYYSAMPLPPTKAHRLTSSLSVNTDQEMVKLFLSGVCISTISSMIEITGLSYDQNVSRSIAKANAGSAFHRFVDVDGYMVICEELKDFFHLMKTQPDVFDLEIKSGDVLLEKGSVVSLNSWKLDHYLGDFIVRFTLVIGVKNEL